MPNNSASGTETHESITRANQAFFLERQHECHHVIPHSRCEAAPEETVECEGGCGRFFCADHLYNGSCKVCFENDEAVAA